MYSVMLDVHVSCSRNTALFVCPWSAALLLQGGTCWVRYWTIVAFMSKRLKCGDMLCRALDSLRDNVVSRSTSCSCSLTIASDGTHLHNASAQIHWIDSSGMCRDHTATSIKLISNLEGLHFKVPTSISSCFGEHGHGTAEMLGISDLIHRSYHRHVIHRSWERTAAEAVPSWLRVPVRRRRWRPHLCGPPRRPGFNWRRPGSSGKIEGLGESSGKFDVKW